MRAPRVLLASAAVVALAVAFRPAPAGAFTATAVLLMILEYVEQFIVPTADWAMDPLPAPANGDVLAGTQEPVGEAPDSYVLHTGPQKFDKLYPVPPDPETFSPDGASRTVWSTETATRLRAAETSDTGAAAFADDKAAVQRLNDLASENDTPDDSLARKIALGNEVGLDAALTAHKTSAMTAQVLQLMSDQAEREAYARRWQDAYARQVLANGYWTGERTWTPDNVNVGW